MGGIGSGRIAGTSGKWTVEDCRCLGLDSMVRHGLLDPGSAGRGNIRWTRPWSNRPPWSASYVIQRQEGVLLLQHPALADDSMLSYRLKLSRTTLPWGGQRWWMHCGLMRGSHACGRRVAKLYLPPGCQYFGCRECHNLTYSSCRESGQPNFIHRRVAEDLNQTPLDIFRSDRRVLQQRAERQKRAERNALRRQRRKDRGWK